MKFLERKVQYTEKTQMLNNPEGTEQRKIKGGGDLQ